MVLPPRIALGFEGRRPSVIAATLRELNEGFTQNPQTACIPEVRPTWLLGLHEPIRSRGCLY
ncbi:hypothetical protein HY405_02145 [Candidatus Microgenomates bacterium]|nr:hypothetical protein [Candidatus Microgenomates bacterium]